MTLKLDRQQMHLISGLLGHFAIKDLAESFSPPFAGDAAVGCYKWWPCFFSS